MARAIRLLICATIAIVIAAMTILAGGTPKRISYQGRAVDSEGNPVSDGAHTAQFTLYNHATEGSALWNESAVPITTNKGLFTYLLGSSVPIPDSVFANYDALHLRIILDGNTLVPRTPITSTGYAMRVNALEGAKGGTIDGGLLLKDTTSSSAYFAQIIPDASGNGAGYMNIRRNGGSQSVLTVDGNYLGIGEPMVSILGTQKSVYFNFTNENSAAVILPTNAVDRYEILDEPGVGGYINRTGFTVTSGLTYLAGRTMFAPSPGYVLVIATADVEVGHSYGQNDVVYFGISDSRDSLLYKTKMLFRVGAGLASEIYHFPTTIHGLFPCDSGAQAYYFLAQHVDGDLKVQNICMTEIFIPTAYTTVTPPTGVSEEVDDPIAERAAALEAHNARVDKELAELKAQVAALKSQAEVAERESSGQAVE